MRLAPLFAVTGLLALAPAAEAGTTDALVTVELRRGRRLVRRLSATAVAGRNVLTLRLPARRGSYRLALTAVAGDQRVTDAARLRVRP